MNAASAHVHGTLNAGTRNMQNPVAMPSGGMTIFRTVTAVRPSRMRHANTPKKPSTALATDIHGRRTIATMLLERAVQAQEDSYIAETVTVVSLCNLDCDATLAIPAEQKNAAGEDAEARDG